jgi:nicotinamide mononucleotide (NMN) deamidase PncC
MATKLLLNSNATTAIAVSGNAMSDQDNIESMKKMGEVFIGVATYIKVPNSDEIKIIVSTQVINFCNEENSYIRQYS